jgi:hypothetical protein
VLPRLAQFIFSIHLDRVVAALTSIKVLLYQVTMHFTTGAVHKVTDRPL